MYGCNRGMGCHPAAGFGMGYGFARHWAPEWSFSQLSEAEWLRQYKERLELHKKDVELELKLIEDRIQKLNK